MRPSLIAVSLMLALTGADRGRAEPVRVSTVTVRTVTSTIRLTLTGSIQARVQSDLAFRIAGKVVSRRIEVGQRVARGDVLATLDDAQERADLDNAAAQLASRQAMLSPAAIDLDRQRELFARGFATKKRLDDAQVAVVRATADVTAARASLAAAREKLSYTILTSTGEGVIVAREVDVGAVIQAGTRIATLALNGPRDAVFAVAEIDARPPIETDVVIASTTDTSIRTTGRVREVAPQVDPATNTVQVKVGIEALPPELTLGSAVMGTAAMARRQIMTLPWSALDRRGHDPAVWVLGPHDKAALRRVEVLRYRTGSFDVGNGLTDGERVVTAGVQFLRPDAAVTVMPGAMP